MRAEFEQFEQRFEQKIDLKFDLKFAQKFEELERKFDKKLDTWGGALIARMDDQQQRFEHRMLTEMARLFRAMEESLVSRISIIDEKYKDLPGRVQRVETVLDGEHRDLPDRVARLEAQVLARKRR
jgi:hypothetical protein